MNTEASIEVYAAVRRISGERKGIISRFSIEHELLKDKARYPYMNGLSQNSQRRLITRIMTAVFPFWSKGHGLCQTSRVWSVDPALIPPAERPQQRAVCTAWGKR